MESHFIMPPTCCEKFDKIESLFESDDADSTTSTSAVEKEQYEPVSTQPALESILESQDEEIEEKEPKILPSDENISSANPEEKPIEDVTTKEPEISSKDEEKPENTAENEILENENLEKEKPEEKTPPENIPKVTQVEETEDKTDNMNSKPTDKSNVENPPPQDEPPADNPPVEDPPEDDPVPSLDSSVDSDEFKCKHCEVDPFPNEDELKQHIKLKHEIKCKFCDSIFPSRGYMMTHQRNDHPKELKALQERRKSKKAQKAAS